MDKTATTKGVGLEIRIERWRLQGKYCDGCESLVVVDGYNVEGSLALLVGPSAASASVLLCA